MLGATGTIGQATLRALVQDGHDVTCFLRPAKAASRLAGFPAGVDSRYGDVTQPGDFAKDGLRSEPFDVVVSCMASRTGMPRDAWAIDHDAHLLALQAAKEAGVGQFVLLSALCVQKPELPFQHAKLAFEMALINSGLVYSIVRPTAFFKSLSGQVERVKAGKPFLLFGDGELTACKPVSDKDLGRYISGCLIDPARQNRVLPIGGPGPAISPRRQGEKLFELLNMTPTYRHVPVRMMDAIIGALSVGGAVAPRLRDKADLARIGRYYATQSMLVWNEETGAYSAEDTPETGQDTLFDFYERLIRGEETVDLGDHAVF
jgi:divinyl chlorophyllide a 8-vinyl-reductase